MSKQEKNAALPTVPYADLAEAEGIDLNTWSALLNSLYPGARPDSIVMVTRYCRARSLDVLKKPVHIVPMKVKIASSNQYEWRDVIFPGIAELRITASRTGLMAGTDEPVFDEDIEHLVKDGAEKGARLRAPSKCKVTVYRLDKNGTPRAYTHVEYFAEAVARDKEGVINSMWRKRPHGQLAKCAEAGALRKAFPEELGGQMTAEEMEGKIIGDEPGSEPVIEGEVTTVPGVPQPVEKTDAQAPAPSPAPAAKPDATGGAAATPAPADAAPAAGAGAAGDGGQAPAKAADVPAGAPAEKGFKVNLPGPALRMVQARLLKTGKSMDEFMKSFGKDLTVATVNEAFKALDSAANGK